MVIGRGNLSADPNSGLYNEIDPEFASPAFASAASTQINAFRKALHHIEAMFPRLPRATLEEVLKATKVYASFALRAT